MLQLLTLTLVFLYALSLNAIICIRVSCILQFCLSRTVFIYFLCNIILLMADMCWKTNLVDTQSLMFHTLNLLSTDMYHTKKST